MSSRPAWAPCGALSPKEKINHADFFFFFLKKPWYRADREHCCALSQEGWIREFLLLLTGVGQGDPGECGPLWMSPSSGKVGAVSWVGTQVCLHAQFGSPPPPGPVLGEGHLVTLRSLLLGLEHSCFLEARAADLHLSSSFFGLILVRAESKILPLPPLGEAAEFLHLAWFPRWQRKTPSTGKVSCCVLFCFKV